MSIRSVLSGMWTETIHIDAPLFPHCILKMIILRICNLSGDSVTLMIILVSCINSVHVHHHKCSVGLSFFKS